MFVFVCLDKQYDILTYPNHRGGGLGEGFIVPSPITAFLFVPFLFAEKKKRDKYP